MSFFTHSTPEVYLIVFKVYDSNGYLISLIDTNTRRIKSKWRTIQSFLHAGRKDEVREVAFKKGGRHFPSIVRRLDGHIHWSEPIRSDIWGVL